MVSQCADSSLLIQCDHVKCSQVKMRGSDGKRKWWFVSWGKMCTVSLKCLGQLTIIYWNKVTYSFFLLIFFPFLPVRVSSSDKDSLKELCWTNIRTHIHTWAFRHPTHMHAHAHVLRPSSWPAHFPSVCFNTVLPDHLQHCLCHLW